MLWSSGHLRRPMVHQSSIETQGWVAQPNPITGGVTMWGSIQSPFGVRMDVADTLGVPESDVTVYGMPVGGAFGAKFGLYEPLTALISATVGPARQPDSHSRRRIADDESGAGFAHLRQTGLQARWLTDCHAIRCDGRYRHLSQRPGRLRGDAIRQLLPLRESAAGIDRRRNQQTVGRRLSRSDLADGLHGGGDAL